MDIQSPFIDHAAPILSSDAALSDDHRAALWNIFHESKDPNELAQRLAPIPVANETKHQLFAAKHATMAPQGPAKVQDVISQMASLDSGALDIAESHPQVLKTLVSAMAGAETKAPTTDEAKKKKQPPTPLAPRLDGSPHLPAIPEGHYRVRASDGSIHDVPQENIAKAQEIDPQLHVMNP